MILEIQGRSDDIVELRFDDRPDQEINLGVDGAVATITVGDPELTQYVIECSYANGKGWVFSMHLAGRQVRERRGDLPGRIDVELNLRNNGPMWIVDAPYDTPLVATRSWPLATSDRFVEDVFIPAAAF